jgi:hypothetical protein
MIARVWRGTTKGHDFDRYLDYVKRTGVKDCLATPGSRGVQLLLRKDQKTGEVLFISLWESFDAIRQFAGDVLDRARYYPEDAGFLLELEPTVCHYDMLTFHGGQTCRPRIVAPPLIFAL